MCFTFCHSCPRLLKDRDVVKNKIARQDRCGFRPFLICTLLFMNLASQFPALSQNLYYLSDCIKIAAEENTQVKRALVDADIADEARKGCTYSFIPSLSLSYQHNLSTGRVLDPTTYQFVTNRTVYDMSASVGGSMTLFAGGERIYQVQKAKQNLQVALLETERVRNDLELNITALFLNLVLDKEAIRVCESKLDLLRKQEELISKKVEYQAATPGDLLGIQADVTAAQVDLATAHSNFDLDRIAMCEQLEMDDWRAFDISTEDQDFDEIQPRMWVSSDLAQSAFALPQIRQRELAIEMAARDVSIAAASFWPTVRLNAGYGSTYSDARVRLNGEEYSFRDQFRDNMSSYVTLSLSVPILSAITVSNNVRQRKLAYTRAGYELTQAKLALDKEVKQALVQADAAYEKYLLLETDVEKCREALRQAERKYDAGAATYYDYQIAVGNLYQAESQRLRVKYEYIFRTRILDFYAGRSR